MRYGPRLNRHERREVQTEKRKNDMGGTGIYVYENNTKGELSLPKPTTSGLRTLGVGKQFQGDSYYMNWVGSPMNLLKLIKEIEPKKTFAENQEIKRLEEAAMHEEMLMLDQPDTITAKGKVEHVVVSGPKKLNDSTDHKKKEALINEDPLDGVEIILG